MDINRLILVSIWQYIQIPNLHAAHLKLTPCCMSIITWHKAKTKVVNSQNILLPNYSIRLYNYLCTWGYSHLVYVLWKCRYCVCPHRPGCLLHIHWLVLPVTTGTVCVLFTAMVENHAWHTVDTRQLLEEQVNEYKFLVPFIRVSGRNTSLKEHLFYWRHCAKHSSCSVWFNLCKRHFYRWKKKTPNKQCC